MGTNHSEKKYQKVPIKIGMSIAIAIGFVFLIVYFSGGMPPQKSKQWENKANGNGTASGNFDWYTFARFV